MSVHSSASESGVSGMSAACKSIFSFEVCVCCFGESADATLSTNLLNLPSNGSLPCW